MSSVWECVLLDDENVVISHSDIEDRTGGRVGLSTLSFMRSLEHYCHLFIQVCFPLLLVGDVFWGFFNRQWWADLQAAYCCLLHYPKSQRRPLPCFRKTSDGLRLASWREMGWGVRDDVQRRCNALCSHLDYKITLL